MGIAVDILGSDGEFAAGFQQDRPTGEGAKTDLGALQVNKHADRVPAVVGGGADPAIDLSVVGMGAMAEGGVGGQKVITVGVFYLLG